MKLLEIYDDVKWIDESILDEDYPTNWSAEEFANISSFSGRMRYAEENLQKIKAGSGRVVYKIDNDKVLKLSKNKKGIAQTQTEITWGNDNYLAKSGILAEIFSFDENGLWVEMQLARKLTRSKFKQIVGVDFDRYGDWLVRQYGRNRGYGDVSEKEDEILWEDDFTREVVDFMVGYKTPAGDLARLSSYGIVGDDELAIIDYGLSGDVYDTYYS